MLQFDNFSVAFSILMITLTIGVFFLSRYYYRENIEHLSDIYALLLFSLVGGIILVSYQNLVMLFLGIEILSIPLYVLAASNRRNLLSNEAGLKYFITGSFATCFLLLGITLIYGTAESFQINEVAEFSDTQTQMSGLFNTGCILLLGALLFKVSAAPFHFWAPDVYHGSPTVITSFMSTVVKTAAFGAILRFISFTIPGQPEIWHQLLGVIAALTMVVGNIIALYQQNLKRMLAYSGVANAGYVLIALATLQENSYQYVLYYMAGYGIATILAFAIYSIIKEQTGRETIEGLNGLSRKNPLLAISLAVSMLSLAGMPPLAGFFGKYAVFSNSISAGNIWLVIIAVVTSLIGVYYYFRVMASAFRDSDSINKIDLPIAYKFILSGGVILLIVLGTVPQLILNYM
jgi:NADH-quinone oxidoreductase subunit N